MEDFEISLTDESIGKYRQKPVTREKIEESLEDAMAVSARDGSQSWQFVVITDVDLLSRVAEINPDAAMVSQSLIAVLVCGDLNLEDVPGSWAAACSTLAHNLLPAAHQQGLAAVMIGIHPETERMDRFRGLFDLPAQIMPHTLVMLGYPAHKIFLDERPRKDCFHYNGW